MKKQILTLSLLASIVAGSTPSAQAGWFSSKKSAATQSTSEPSAQSYINLSAPSPKEAEMINALTQFRSQMTESLKEIQVQIDQGETEQAMTSAQALLDKVRFDLGVDPKAKLTESFFLNTTFPEDAVKLSDLPEQQQILLIKSLRDFKGGLFLDILNLSKRASLLYTKAFKAALIKSGGTLSSEDKQKIIQDLATAVLSPLPIVDRTGRKITVFGSEVTNENLYYLFDKELKNFFAENPDAGASAGQFELYLELKKSSLIPKQLEVFKRAALCMQRSRLAPRSDYRDQNHEQCFASFSPMVGTFQNCMLLVQKYVQISSAETWYRGADKVNGYSRYLENSFQSKCEAQYPLK